MPAVQSLQWNDTDDDLRQGCIELWERVWPNPPEAAKPPREERVAARYGSLEDHRIHVVVEDGAVLAVARTFLQTVTAKSAGVDRDIDVVALASVCSHPDRRGEDLGNAVMTAAFDHVAEAARPSLFQTGVPNFYERFGSRIISNEVMTSAVGEEAFTDEYVMIHPGDQDWDDEATIDLQIAGW